MGNRMDAVSTCGQMVVYMWETTSTVTDKAKGTQVVVNASVSDEKVLFDDRSKCRLFSTHALAL